MPGEFNTQKSGTAIKALRENIEAAELAFDYSFEGDNLELIIAKNAEQYAAEKAALLAGPKGSDDESMIQWIGKWPTLYSLTTRFYGHRHWMIGIMTDQIHLEVDQMDMPLYNVLPRFGEVEIPLENEPIQNTLVGFAYTWMNVYQYQEQLEAAQDAPHKAARDGATDEEKQDYYRSAFERREGIISAYRKEKHQEYLHALNEVVQYAEIPEPSNDVERSAELARKFYRAERLSLGHSGDEEWNLLLALSYAAVRNKVGDRLDTDIASVYAGNNLPVPALPALAERAAKHTQFMQKMGLPSDHAESARYVQINPDGAKTVLSSSREAQERIALGKQIDCIEQDSPFILQFNTGKDGGYEPGHVNYQISEQEPPTPEAFLPTLKALQQELLDTDPAWLLTNTDQFRDLKKELNETIQALEEFPELPNAEYRQKMMQRLEQLAHNAGEYAERKQSDFRNSDKERDHDRWVAASKIAAFAGHGAKNLAFLKEKSYEHAIESMQFSCKKILNPNAGSKPDSDAVADFTRSFCEALRMSKNYPEDHLKQEALSAVYTLVYPKLDKDMQKSFRDEVSRIIPLEQLKAGMSNLVGSRKNENRSLSDSAAPADKVKNSALPAQPSQGSRTAGKG